MTKSRQVKRKKHYEKIMERKMNVINKTKDKKMISEYTHTEDKTLTASISESFYIEYKKDGEVYHVETFPGKSIYYVEDAAYNWAKKINALEVT
tara:strand:- start:97 stop:378 length:282 start_codon:yes stop_codon:yes gene_type:complete